MAKEVLGTFIKKRKRLAKPHGLHSLQSCKTWLCSKSGRVALWVIPSCCKAGIVSGRLGSKRTSIHQWNGFGIRVGWIKRERIHHSNVIGGYGVKDNVFIHPTLAYLLT